MSDTLKRFPLILFVFFFFSLFDVGLMAEDADARSRSGGRSYSSSPTYNKPPAQSPTRPSSTPTGGGFMRGMAGGLVGGAIGSMLFGGLASGGTGGGIGGSGIGLFQILLFGGIAYFIYRRFFNKRKAPAYSSYQQTGTGEFSSGSMPGDSSDMHYPPPSPSFGGASLAEGIAMIRRSEPDFDPDYFKEVAQDVFFQVQAGWMRRDIDAYRHLLGQRLAQEYEGHFAEMRANGHINKLENIAVRKVEVVAAGVDDNEEFVTVLFTANLLDYTVDEQNGSVVKGSNTEPVKFAEKWTWARPVATETWKLEGIEVVQD
ncbi:MAG: Tim44 domain-containing protein [Desulfobulbaceae bacterium]|nr:Tim44 domain-containing protein [Desulfobulbaceae bacterium]